MGYEDDAFIKGQEFEGTGRIPLEDVIGDDRFTVWENSTEDGPSSCAKTTAKFLSNLGNDAIVDEDSQMNWLADGVALRDELEGLGIIYAKVQRESDRSDYMFNHPIFVNEATGDLIVTDGNASGGSETDQNGSSDDSSESESDSTSEASDGTDGPVAEFYDTCADLSINTEPAVLGLLEDMVDDDDNDLTEDMVDRDEIVADLVE